MALSKENRRAKRVRHDSVLEIFDQGGHFIASIGRLIDFSTVGACFSTPTSFSKGDKLQVRLRMLKEGYLEGSARVVWRQKKVNRILYGIEFGQMHQIRK